MKNTPEEKAFLDITYTSLARVVTPPAHFTPIWSLVLHAICFSLKFVFVGGGGELEGIPFRTKYIPCLARAAAAARLASAVLTTKVL